MPIGRARALKQELSEKANADIAAHPAWPRGFGLGSSSSGLAPCEVTKLAQPTIAKALSELAAFDPVVQENPKRPTQPTLSCAARLFGICKSEPHSWEAACLTFNVYARLKDLGFKRATFPHLHRYTVGAETELAIFTDYVGKGETTLHLALQPAADAGLAIAAAMGVPVCLSGQRLFSHLLRKAAATAALPADAHMEVLELTQVPGQASFTISRAGAVLKAASIPLKWKLQAKVAKKPPEDNELPLGLSWAGPGESRRTEATAEEWEQHLSKKPENGSDDEDSSDSELNAEEKGGKAAERDTEKEQEALKPEAAPVRRLGVFGYDEKVTAKSSCLVCVDKKFPTHVCKFEAGSGRFYFRWKRNKPDRSVHKDCLLSGALLSLSGCRDEHWLNSAEWFENCIVKDDLEPSLKTLFLDACHVFRQHLSVSLSASSGSAGAPAGAASSGSAAPAQ